MEEFSALAARVAASVGELKGCLILSRDGLVLGAFPEGEEALVKPAWLRFATLGEPDKGFVEFGDEVWGYVRRGPYASFAVTGTGVRPGLLVDQLEQLLLAAEEARARREALRIPEAPAAPSGKPRTSLHPEVKPPAPAPVAPRAAPAAANEPPAPEPPAPRPKEPPVPAAAEPPAADAPMPHEATLESADPPIDPFGSPEPSSPTPDREEDEPGEVDRVMLAQEFSRLLQETPEGDET